MSEAHPRIPAAPLLAGAYLAGTIASSVFGWPWLATLVVGGLAASGVVLLGWWSTPRSAVLLMAVALATVAHVRFDDANASLRDVSLPLGSHEVVGTAREDARVRGLTARVDVEIETIDGAAADGGVRATLPAPLQPIRAGERLEFEMELEAPPEVEDFDYAAFLASRDIQAVGAFPERWERLGSADSSWWDRFPAIRRWATGRIERALPEPESSLAAGVLVGEHRSMPEDLTEALRATGTTHLVVVSGQNVALLLGLAISVLTLWIPRRQAALTALIGLLLPYVLLVGADPPVVRAAVMSVGIVIASVLGRRTPGWIYLAYAVALMLMWNPMYARDVAFQLSATATLGVIVLAPAMTEFVLERLRWPTGGLQGTLVELTVTATAATVAVMPVQVAAFERVSLIAIPANVIVAPLYEGTVAVAAVAAFVGGIAELEPVLRPVLVLIPAAFIRTVEVLAAVPAAEFAVQAPLLVGLGWYLAVAVLVWWLDRRGAVPQVLEHGTHSGLAWSAGLAVLGIGLWLSVLQPRDERARVTVLDVGQGLAVLVEDGGRSVLIDTGPPDAAVVGTLPGRLGELSAVVLTHADADHAGGLLPVAGRIDIGALFASERTLAEFAEAEALGGQSIDLGDQLRVSERVVIDVVSPPVATAGRAFASKNDSGLVLLVTMGDRRVLIAADIEAPAEAWLVASGQSIAADVLVVPHHGSKTSSSAEFIEAVRPTVAVLSVGPNPYGHPAADVVARYSEAALLRTDEVGSVTFTSDGERLWVRSER